MQKNAPSLPRILAMVIFALSCVLLIGGALLVRRVAGYSFW